MNEALLLILCAAFICGAGGYSVRTIPARLIRTHVGFNNRCGTSTSLRNSQRINFLRPSIPSIETTQALLKFGMMSLQNSNSQVDQESAEKSLVKQNDDEISSFPVIGYIVRISRKVVRVLLMMFSRLWHMLVGERTGNQSEGNNGSEMSSLGRSAKHQRVEPSLEEDIVEDSTDSNKDDFLTMARRTVEKRLRELERERIKSDIAAGKPVTFGGKTGRSQQSASQARSPMDSFLPPPRKVVSPVPTGLAVAPNSTVTSWSGTGKELSLEAPSSHSTSGAGTNQNRISLKIPLGLASFLPSTAIIKACWKDLTSSWKILKSNGRSGKIALAITEIGFFSLFPIAIDTYAKFTGRCLSDIDDPITIVSQTQYFE